MALLPVSKQPHFHTTRPNPQTPPFMGQSGLSNSPPPPLFPPSSVPAPSFPRCIFMAGGLGKGRWYVGHLNREWKLGYSANRMSLKTSAFSVKHRKNFNIISGLIINNSDDNRGKYVTSEYLWNEYTISSRLTVKNFTAQDVGR